MQFNVTYDANTLATAPSGFFSAVNYVVTLFDTTFTNTATVNIEVGYGDFPYDGSQVTSYLGLNQQNNVVSASYSQVRQALINEGAPGASTLPSTSPLNGQLELGSAQEKALGLIGSSSALDGWVGIASNAELQRLDGTSWSFSSTATPTAAQYYLIGVIEHEFSEVMGRSSYLDTRGEYGIIDLYRYAAANVRQTGTGDPAYFSINNGVTNLDSFNNPHVAAGDLSDWAPNAGPSGVFKYAAADAFDNNSLPGQINALTSTDLTLMEALGWGAATPVSPPPPPPPPAASPPPPPLPIPTAPNDFYGNGFSDILWQNTDGTVAIWEMNGATVIADPIIANPGTAWRAIGGGDFNGDGYSDILFQHTDGSVAIWEMNGAIVTADPIIANPGTSWKAIGAGDFNHDGSILSLPTPGRRGRRSAAAISTAMVIPISCSSIPTVRWRFGTAAPVIANPGTSWHPVLGSGSGTTVGGSSDATFASSAATDTASSSNTTTASGAQSTVAAVGFGDISEPVPARSATASSADIMPVFPNTGGDPLLFPTGSTPPPADPNMPHGTLFG